jgi:hypothetical protein
VDNEDGEFVERHVLWEVFVLRRILDEFVEQVLLHQLHEVLENLNGNV